MKENDSLIRFLYGTVPGRGLLRLIQKTHADRLIVRFLRSGRSRFVIGWYARRHGIPLTREQRSAFRSYRDFFARKREHFGTDITPDHLISPCDGWLSAYLIRADSSFSIKNSLYRVGDLLDD